MKTLEEIPIGKKFKIIGFYGRGVEMKICNIINPEKAIEVVSKQLLGGPIVLKINNYEFAIGRGIAKKILVKEYNGEK